MIDTLAIAEGLDALRMAKGWSTRHLADLAGTSQRTVLHVLHAAGTTKIGTVNKVAAALGAELRVSVVPIEGASRHAGV